MKAFLRSSKTNDLIINSVGGVETVVGAKAVGTIVDSVVKTVSGELYYDTTKGVPYFSTIFRGEMSIPIWESSVREAISQCDGVKDISDFETIADTDGGTLSYRASIVTDEGSELALENLVGRTWSLAEGEVLYSSGLTNEEKIRKIEDELATYVGSLYYDEEEGIYYRWTYDPETGQSVKDPDRPVGPYSLVAYPYWQRMASLVYDDATQLIVQLENNETHTIGVSVQTGGSVKIDWGDGVSSEATNTSFTSYAHTYAQGGTHLISILGDINRVRCDMTTAPGSLSRNVLAILNFSSSTQDLESFAQGESLSYGDITPLSQAVSCHSLKNAFSGCVGLTGVIPTWMAGLTDCSGAFKDITGITLATGANLDADVLMPRSITTYADCVSGCSYDVRKRFWTSWGGSNGWNGSVYTSSDAPVSSLVGERVYSPVANTNSFEIKVSDASFVDDEFTFNVRLAARPGRDVRVDWGDGTSTIYANADLTTLTSKSHVYEKPTETSGYVRYVISIDSGAKAFAIGSSTSDTSSLGVVSRALSWSNTLIGAENIGAYAGCTGMIGTVPQWGPSMVFVQSCFSGCASLQGEVPAWTNTIRLASYCFSGCIGLTGDIPSWVFVGSMNVVGVYKGCVGLTAPTDATEAQLMPSAYVVGSVAADKPVAGATLLMPRFYDSWGGTIPDPYVYVAFDTDGGSEIETQRVPRGSSADRPTNPTKTGYDFNNWYTDTGYGTAFDFSSPLTDDVTVYAKFVIKTFTVTFDTDEGSSIPSQSVTYGSQASVPQNNPTWAGHEFAGWYADSGFQTAYNFTTPVTGNITVYAKYTISAYLVSFSTDGGTTVASKSVVPGGYAPRPTSNPTKTDNLFIDWYEDSNYEHEFDFETKTINSDTTIYGRFEQYLTFTNSGTSSGTLTLKKEGYPPSVNLQYRRSNGSNWHDLSVGTGITVAAGASYMISAKEAGNETFSTSSTDYYYFDCGFTCSASGTVQSLFNQTTHVDTVPEYAFYCLFGWDYEGRPELIAAPKLTARTLSANCYRYMFYNCTSLTTAPTLPATTLADSCYYGMFYNCTSLTTAPTLPATTLAESCYVLMFNNCTSLTTAPTLPATTLATDCYMYMFVGCESLNHIRVNFTSWDIGGDVCTWYWTQDVAIEGTFTCPSALGNGETIARGYSYCPNYWTVENV